MEARGRGQQLATFRWVPPAHTVTITIHFMPNKPFPLRPAPPCCLQAQPWLLPWCQRWGLARAPASAGCPPLVSVAAVHVYAPHPPLAPLGQQQGQGEGASGAGLPAQVLYVPCFQN